MMKTPVFVYGTLSHPSVVQVLLGRPILTKFPKAQVSGFSRHPVKNYAFPGMIPRSTNPDKKVDGFLLEDLSFLDRKLLDWFEGEEYTRQTVQALLPRDGVDGTTTTTNGEELVTAECYIWKQSLIGELELDNEWSYETFCKDKLAWYLDNTVRPCRREMEALGMTKDI